MIADQEQTSFAQMTFLYLLHSREWTREGSPEKPLNEIIARTRTSPPACCIPICVDFRLEIQVESDDRRLSSTATYRWTFLYFYSQISSNINILKTLNGSL